MNGNSPPFLNRGMSYPNNVSTCLRQWKYCQLLNGSIINGRFTVMFENKGPEKQTKPRHEKLWCHSGIWRDMEGMLQGWPIHQAARRCTCSSVRHTRAVKKPKRSFRRGLGSDPGCGSGRGVPVAGMWSTPGTDPLVSKVSHHLQVKHFRKDN